MGSRRIVGFALAPITTRSWPTGRWRWRSRSAAARCPAWCSTPTRAASTPRAGSGQACSGWASASRWAGRVRRWTTRSSSRGTPPWSSSCGRLQQFATRAAARAAVAAWIEEYNHVRRHSALGMRPGGLRAGAGGKGRRVTAAGPLRGPGKKRRRLRRRCPCVRRAKAYGAAPPASRVLRIALRATALRAALDPGDLCGPSGQEKRAGHGLPRRARGAKRAVRGGASEE